jgi:single-stranded DNA-binding protein
MSSQYTVTLTGEIITENPILAIIEEEPEVRFAFCTKHVITSETEEPTEELDEHLCVAYGFIAEALSQCVVGDKLEITGNLTTKSWFEEDGTERYQIDVVVKSFVKQ